MYKNRFIQKLKIYWKINLFKKMYKKYWFKKTSNLLIIQQIPFHTLFQRSLQREIKWFQIWFKTPIFEWTIYLKELYFSS